MQNKLALSIRTNKLAVLLKDARLATGRSEKDIAAALAVSVSTLHAYESGEKSPSLPELEILAYYLDFPVTHFWGNTAMSENGEAEGSLDVLHEVLDIRTRMVGTLLKQARKDVGISRSELSIKTGISTSRIKDFESEQHAVPVPELELLVNALGRSLQEFQDMAGPVADWLREQRYIEQLIDMPTELQEFVCKPYNRPYIEIAQRLSEMSVDKLRNVAEGLLEITL